MTGSFGIAHIVEYLKEMGIKIAHLDHKQEIIEIIFHGEHGQWRMVVGIQHKGHASKLMLIAPHIGIVTTNRRLQCLEALMAANYRIVIGKFGLDLEDGEVRLEETIPLADNKISFEQFRLAFSAMMRTVSIYHSLLPRIVYGNLSAESALQACEQEYLQHTAQRDGISSIDDVLRRQRTTRPTEALTTREDGTGSDTADLNVEDVLAEVTRMLKKREE